MDRETEDRLVAAATAVRASAYAPYSGFAVGAALLTADGRIFTGCNVENASYGLSMCAERNAVAAAVATGARDFRGLALVTAVSPPSAPCGSCRQVLAEFGNPIVVLANPAGERERTTLDVLLPRAFRAADLNRV